MSRECGVYVLCFSHLLESVQVVYVSPLKWDYFWSRLILYRICYGGFGNVCVPTCMRLYCRMIVGQSCEMVSVLCMEYYKGPVFLNDSRHDGDSFVILFKADGKVVDNGEIGSRRERTSK